MMRMLSSSCQPAHGRTRARAAAASVYAVPAVAGRVPTVSEGGMAFMALWSTTGRHHTYRTIAMFSTLLASAALIAATLAAPLVAAQQRPTASAEVRDPTGRVLATAELREGSSEVIVLLTLPNPPVLSGVKGLHIHERGRCDPPDYSTAGGIFNPLGREHGLQNRNGPMVGDLPNVLFTSGGLSSYNGSAVMATLNPGQTSLLDADGSALIMTSDIDDGRTQPDGNSGSRIGCGVIVAGGPAAPAVGVPAGAPTFTPRPAVLPPQQSFPTPTPARTATPAAAAAAKPTIAVPARPTVAATLTAFALSVGKPGAGAPAAQPAATKPSAVVPVVNTGQQPAAAAAQQQQQQPQQAGGGPPPAALIAGLGIILLGAGYAVGRMRRT